MFTGLVAGLGTVAEVRPSREGARLSIATPLAVELSEGDSIAVNGCCLTATALGGGSFSADVMNATLGATALAGLRAGELVNLELPLRAGDRFGGHIVQGHIDGVGEIAEVLPDGFSRRLRIAARAELLRYVVEHGSIAVNGVSLTVAAVAEESFGVSLIPETLQRTNLGGAHRGQR